MFRFIAASHGQSETAPKSVGAITIDEAFRYTRRRYPEFRIAEIRSGELIELVSGSPVDCPLKTGHLRGCFFDLEHSEPAV
jgi:hypothetical protein